MMTFQPGVLLRIAETVRFVEPVRFARLICSTSDTLKARHMPVADG
jgi:hypothetical protein